MVMVNAGRVIFFYIITTKNEGNSETMFPYLHLQTHTKY